MPRRGLLSVARSNSDSTPGSESVRRGQRPQVEAEVDLPIYQAPTFPLTDDKQRWLPEFASIRDWKDYEERLQKSAELLKTSTAYINDRLAARKHQVRQLEGKRTEDHDGDEEEAALQSASAAASELEEKVRILTERSESALRTTLDRLVEAQDERAVLKDVPAIAAREQRSEEVSRVAGETKRKQSPGAVDEDEDAPMPDAETVAESTTKQLPAPPSANIPGLLTHLRETKAVEYGQMSAYEKYGRNNEYISFRRTLHDAYYPEDEVDLPDATTWFASDGKPRLPKPHQDKNAPASKREPGADSDEDAAGRTSDQDGSDDDLMVERQVRSFRCPLTLQILKDPLTSKLCGHTFEKEAILALIKDNREGMIKCPERGCLIDTLTVLDLYTDEVILRKLKRAEQAQQDADGDSDDEEGQTIMSDANTTLPQSARLARESTVGTLRVKSEAR